MLKGLKSQADLGQYGQVTPDFVRIKGKKTPALIEKVIVYLEKDHEKFGKVPVSFLADILNG